MVKDLLVLVGYNAKVRSDACQEQAGTVGKLGLGKTNDRGIRPLEFA